MKKARRRTKHTRHTNKTLKQRFVSYALIACCALFAVSVLLTLPLRWFNPFTTAFIVQEPLEEQKLIPLNWIPYADIADNLAISIVASEDQKFPHHYGFDFTALSKALNEDREQTRGASTITQQLVKNIYLWSGRSYFRKGLEAYLTVLIECFLPKRRILEIYLNVVEFAPGIYGIGRASRELFFRSPSQISAHQAALLAAVLPNPKGLSAKYPSQYVLQRAAQIQIAVKSLGGPGYLRNL
ncbi:MAG: monofunctional biosynthetic peptidoglycan transglycosylase [Psychromonas sp.]|jgi:monofunctional biosynthetic peptidoglycan transglycosylase|uniref:monofunctional biosynthetic peptidoglycan transglycosylase n=1 Tax=Psychromonas sp. TaxID=1884585 RepID=UPI0039E6D32F